MTTTFNVLRVALVGAGSMGRRHAHIIRRSENARLTGVADPDAATVRELAGEDAGISTFDGFESLVSQLELDVVHVCSPPALHFDHARAALAAGCHVYVEKPFTQTVREADELLELARFSNLKICAGHQLKLVFPPDDLETHLREVSPFTHVESHFHFRPSAAKAARLRADEQLLDILPHPLYLLLHFLEGVTDSPGSVVTEGLTVGPGATVHALLRRGDLTGLLHVTLEGRPVDSHVRIVGAGGELTLDYIREGIYMTPDRGGSGIGKIVGPLSMSRQTASAALRAGVQHVLGRGTAYPGLGELIEAFHRSILEESEPPVSAAEIRSTVEISEAVSRALEGMASEGGGGAEGDQPLVVVTGGTGFLGRPTVRALVKAGARVRVFSRRGAPPWERLDGVEYVVCDLSEDMPADAFARADVVVHAAAATAGGWEAHEASSVRATENVLRSAAAAGVGRVLYVSSLAVVGPEQPGAPISETSPLLEDPEEAGPYTWGKTAAERLARDLAGELGLELKVVRPGAIIDITDFEPPGRLGRGIGSGFVAVGSPEERLGVVERDFAARTICRGCLDFEGFPDVLHLLQPDLPTRGELVRKLRDAHPSVRVLWMPRFLLRILDPLAALAQRMLRPGSQSISLREVFREANYDTERVTRYAESSTRSRDARPGERLPQAEEPESTGVR